MPYDGDFQLYRHMWQMEASVFPKAIKVATPVAFLTIGLQWMLQHLELKTPSFSGGPIWASFNAALGILIVFRTQQAYSRWWEGGSLLQQIRGEWYNATSSLIAFTSREKTLRRNVVSFQHLVIRLMSMLYCSALRQVTELDDDRFEILNVDCIDDDTLLYLRDCERRTEVICHWVQRLIIDSMNCGILPIPAPVMTRVFQELSRGMVSYNKVQILKEFPFPFPYVQMVNFLLLLQWVMTPIANAFIVTDHIWSGVLSFISVFCFWGINYIAQEIEMPFGDDVNDLPIADMQKDMNRSLLMLLERKAQIAPVFSHDGNRISMRREDASSHNNRKKAIASSSLKVENFGSTIRRTTNRAMERASQSANDGDHEGCPDELILPPADGESNQSDVDEAHMIFYQERMSKLRSYIGDGDSDNAEPEPDHELRRTWVDVDDDTASKTASKASPCAPCNSLMSANPASCELVDADDMKPDNSKLLEQLESLPQPPSSGSDISDLSKLPLPDETLEHDDTELTADSLMASPPQSSCTTMMIDNTYAISLAPLAVDNSDNRRFSEGAKIGEHSAPSLLPHSSATRLKELRGLARCCPKDDDQLSREARQAELGVIKL